MVTNSFVTSIIYICLLCINLLVIEKSGTSTCKTDVTINNIGLRRRTIPRFRLTYVVKSFLIL